MLAAFITGLVGSLHCLGMCGPIALALPGTARQGWSYFVGRLLYNLGRLSTYAVLGAIVALLGVAAAMFEVQRWFSLILGMVMLVLALHHFGVWGKRFAQHDNFFTRSWRRGMGQVMRIRGLGGMFALGLMNGILPCGLVYAGLFIAAHSSTAWEGAAKMALFGLGTLPLMLSLSWSGKWLGAWLKQRSRMIMPSMMTFLGILFLLRGMALGIPYVSPRLEQGSAPGKVKMSCCEKIEGDKAPKSQSTTSLDSLAPQTQPSGKP
jgi:sulfite exporter TauE/SafE